MVLQVTTRTFHRERFTVDVNFKTDIKNNKSKCGYYYNGTVTYQDILDYVAPYRTNI